MDLAAFVAKWSQSGASERANKDHFLLDLCDVLEVPRPSASTGDAALDLYSFERDAVLVAEGEKRSVGKIDLYKHGCFLLEAKQGSEPGAHKLGSARRGTPGWTVAMMNAHGQAAGYAKTLDEPPPFLITCDIGYCFDLYASFDGTWNYQPFPTAQASRVYLSDLAKHRERLRAVFLDPHTLDPSRRAAKVTREVAAHLAELARELEAAGHGAERVAAFLMRCLFTMFAEDVGLLPKRLFVDELEKNWIPHPERFPVGLMNLWSAMNVGGFWPTGKLLQFNGGLFADQTVLPLTKPHLARLLEAARSDWAEVEPAIFGTLLERALDPEERHALGAHYTPRAYVERLVRPTIEEPLRVEWTAVQAEVRDLVARGKENQAEAAARTFHQRLCGIRVLDPACGSGNFLYVTLDLFKRLESEVVALVSQLAKAPVHANLLKATVTPAQFLGIEIKPWAKEIAELVLWIGYLQWHFRTHGDVAPDEPVLRDYKNIECRDAVLEYDAEETALGKDGQPVTRWDGRTMKKHPVTGEDVPDDSARIAVMQFVNPRRASWPEADFVVGNPPFVGNKRMRDALGDGYVEALRAAHDDVPETSDFVMYWWHHAAGLVRAGKAQRFGLITTNSITQTFNRKVVQKHLAAKPPLSLSFAVPDHPWVDSASGAAVRIAMTVAVAGERAGRLCEVVAEKETGDDEVAVELAVRVGRIHADLTTGAPVASVLALRANRGMCQQGVKLVGDGFILAPEEARAWPVTERPIVKPFVTNKDLVQRHRRCSVIDLHGLSETVARETFPTAMQSVIDRVRPLRLQNRDEQRKRDWWLFGRSNERMRASLRELPRFIITPEVSKHRPFVFVETNTIPDASLYAVGSHDAFLLGVLSSRIHVSWALAAGGTLEDRPRYQNGPCFDPFPFPAASDAQKARIRELGESLDAHRKRQQALHPQLTLTGMYNVLEKLRSGAALTAKEQKIHADGLVSVLKQIHDDLDAAVFDAYGWPPSLTDEQLFERLVALNAERAAEESRGLVRWLRPEFQNPSGAVAATQSDLPGEPSAPAAKPTQIPKWPAKFSEQVLAVRNAVAREDRSWSAEEVARSFKSARRGAVADALDSLSALGLIVAFDASGEKRWKALARSAA